MAYVEMDFFICFSRDNKHAWNGLFPERATGYNLYEECLFEGYFMGNSATNHVCFHVSRGRFG
ncbi:hypothetical protein CE91St24_03620 [Odoribacteraceae bacterium]|nr:hypothetical protein CE91St21_40660 [Odoribacteraceae bacterium]GKH95495.1 hypothetical protein CE91St23_39910 [Odoribacteraceae bacterium]GKH98119.1 hypothetical protein CE91St22_19970 [Odoribacteraceae bacterium]GKI01087.1 hypothetical protein CE91St24_03620 [Odoribacteraceae bacterium]